MSGFVTSSELTCLHFSSCSSHLFFVLLTPREREKKHDGEGTTVYRCCNITERSSHKFPKRYTHHSLYSRKRVLGSGSRAHLHILWHHYTALYWTRNTKTNITVRQSCWVSRMTRSWLTLLIFWIQTFTSGYKIKQRSQFSSVKINFHFSLQSWPSIKRNCDRFGTPTPWCPWSQS